MKISSIVQQLRTSLNNSAGTIAFGMEDGTVSIFGLLFGVAATMCLRLDDAQLTQLPQRLHEPADFEPAFANAKREKRKTSRYIAGYLDERAALHLSFLPARRSHVFLWLQSRSLP